MSFTGSVLSSKWDLVNVSDHFLLPPNKHTPHVACLEVVWYYRRVWEVFTHMIITLHLSTGAYCSSRKPDKTIPNRHSCPLRGFSRRSIQPFNLALSSLPLLFSSLYSPFPGPPQASYPSSPPTLLMGSHSLPNVNKCNIYHFSKHFRQQFWTTEGLTEKEDETPLSHWGYHHDVFQFVFCRRKVNVSQFFSFIFSSKEVSKLNLFKAARCFIHKFLE